MRKKWINHNLRNKTSNQYGQGLARLGSVEVTRVEKTRPDEIRVRLSDTKKEEE